MLLQYTLLHLCLTTQTRFFASVDDASCLPWKYKKEARVIVWPVIAEGSKTYEKSLWAYVYLKCGFEFVIHVLLYDGIVPTRLPVLKVDILDCITNCYDMVFRWCETFKQHFTIPSLRRHLRQTICPYIQVFSARSRLCNENKSVGPCTVENNISLQCVLLQSTVKICSTRCLLN